MLAALLISVALGFPDTDPHREVGVPLGTSQAVTRGAWSAEEGLHLAEAPDPRSSTAFWMSADPDHWVGDGLVRARVRLSGAADFTVLVRGIVDADAPESLDALGLSVEEDRLIWHRWDDGVVRSTGAETRLPLGRRNRLELVVTMVGPQLTAFAYDPDTLEQLAAIAVREPGLSGGQVGFRVHVRHDAGTRLEHLAVMADSAGWWAAAPLQEPVPHGHERLLVFPSDQADRLPRDLSRLVVPGWPFDPGDTPLSAVLTDRGGVERARRAGVEAVDIRGEIPRWALSDGYRSQRGQPPVPTERGFRLDLGYKDAHMVADLLRAYAARYPDLTRLETLGTTHRGEPILALRISDHPERDEDEPAFLVMAAHHGSELLATEYALDTLARLLEGYATDPRVKARVDGLELWVVPLVNPDGNLVTMEHSNEVGRKNGRDTDGNGTFETHEGVDLNRNYPFQWGALGEEGSRSWTHSYYFRGPSAGSEPETQAVMALADRRRFVAAISWHTNGTVILSPYTIDGVANPEPDVAWAIAEELAAAAPLQPGGRQFKVIRKMYSVDGTDQDWLFHEHGTIAYIVEGSHHNPYAREVRRGSIAGVRPIADTLMDRALLGPRVSGHTRDADGRPVEAVVSLAEQHLGAGERWSSRRSDGRFDRLLAAPGSYTVVAEAEGHATARRRVEVGEGPVEVELVLEARTTTD